jgi:branched-chain amino acid transport system substrate-binding protein
VTHIAIRWISSLKYCCITAAIMLPALSLHAQREQQFRVPVDSSGLRIFLRHLPAARAGVQSGRSPVLFIHGSSFPSALAAAFKFDGTSWMDDLSRSGFDVWALDFLGYGGSDRYPEMRDPPFAHLPLGRADQAARQIEAAVAFITSHQRVTRVSLIAHSWGTIPAGLYAGAHPQRIDRLVQFGPVAQRKQTRDTTRIPAYEFVTEEAQRSRFYGYVPTGEPPVLDVHHFAVWGPAYMATDPMSRTRNPASVAVPGGPDADVNDAWSGKLGYDPSAITAPVLIVRGEWDKVTRDADAEWLYTALTHSPLKRDVKISRATHVMHLEASRYQLYREVATFLSGDDVAEKPVAVTRAGTRIIRIAGFGALSGPARSFGINSRAALTAAADRINTSGGVRLADGAIGKFKISYADDHCNAAVATGLVHQFAASDALVAVGPSCSSVAEPLYHSMQSIAGVAADTGTAMPIFTDGATKANLARISEWVFRNSPNETDMYHALWAWVRTHHPDWKTVSGGDEADFAHSHSTWQNIIGPQAEAAGFSLIGSTGWSITDTNFTSPVRRLAAISADVVVLSAHATTTCGMLREMAREHMRPKLIVGLTSASTPETLQRCGAYAEGLLIPTSFSPMTPAARSAAAAVERAGGIADLHSMAAWEILYALKQVIETHRVLGTPESVASDREAIRVGLTSLHTIDGLLGTISRTRDRESQKPFVLVQARHGTWQVVQAPAAIPAKPAHS